MICIVVYGKPEPQGSTRAFMPKRGRFPVITSANKNLTPWRQQVTRMALAATKSFTSTPDKPVVMELDFYLRRPKSIPKKRVDMITRPDIDKLIRAILDACTGVLYVDDSQVVNIQARKQYGDPERVEIKVVYQ